MRLKPREGFCLLAVAVCLFIWANRAAYRGYFSDDDLDTLAWTRLVPWSDYLWGLLSPRFQTSNFRPLGHLWMFVANRVFGLNYSGYVAAVQCLHLTNVVLVWFIVRRLGAPVVAASAGTLFFAFHMALFDVYWKPMYLYDALCATCILGSVLFYSHRRWILSFLLFWLAYKAKELAVVAPVILIAWEYWFGERRLLRVVPFFAVSACFGLQAVFANAGSDNDYTFRFTSAALARTVPFYTSRIFLVPWAGLTLLLLPLAIRDKRVWFGLLWAGVVFFPLLFLPGRVFSAYCYLPLAGISLSLSFIAAKHAAWIPAGLAIAWVLWNLPVLRAEHRIALDRMEGNRNFATALFESAGRLRTVHTLLYDVLPADFHVWGVTGILQYSMPGSSIKLETFADRSPADALRAPGVALLHWNSQARQLNVVYGGSEFHQSSAIRMGPDSPDWQLGDGWFALEGTFRWIQPRATAYLHQPASATQFVLEVNVGPDLLRQVGPVSVEILVNGKSIGTNTFGSAGIAEANWSLPADLRGEQPRCPVEFRVSPGYQVPGTEKRKFGIAVRAFGFAE